MPGTTYQADDLLILQHIRKTGGSTVRWSLASKFPPNRVFRCYSALGCSLELDLAPKSDPWKQRIRFFVTNHDFGSHRYFSRPCTYITMLREPDIRVLSRYYHLITLGAATGELDDYLESLPSQLADNYQVRVLSQKRAVQNVDETDLARAKENLQAAFSAVGLVEAFNASLALFAKVCGWPTIPLVKRNVNRERPPLTSLTGRQRQLLHQHNTLDHELYAFGRQLFEDLTQRHKITPEYVARTVKQDGLTTASIYLNRAMHKIYRRVSGLT